MNYTSPRCTCYLRNMDGVCPLHARAEHAQPSGYTPSGMDEFHPDTTHNPGAVP